MEPGAKKKKSFFLVLPGPILKEIGTMLRFQMLFKMIEEKQKFRIFAWSYNPFHNILRLFDILTNFPFTSSETMGDYYLQT